MEPINRQNRPKSSICPHSIGSYGFNRFLERIRSWSPSNSALRCQECEKEEMGKSSKMPNEVPFGAKFLWLCLECDRIFCGAESLSPPNSHIRSHALKNNHLFAIPIDAGCLACNPVPRIMTLEANKELEINKELACKPIQQIMTLESNKGLEKNKEFDAAIEVLAKQLEDSDNLSSDYVVRPMQNKGDTSFFNAILQNLLSMSVLRANFEVLGCPDRPITHDLWVLFRDTDDVLEDDEVITRHADLLASVCRQVPSFGGQQEHDSHEFLTKLLNLLLAEGTSFIRDVFGGKLSSTVSCVQCGKVSKSYKPFLDLSLAIPSAECSAKNDEVGTPRDPVDLSSQFPRVKPYVSARKRLRFGDEAPSGNNNGDPLSIKKCLDLFIAPEILYGECVCVHCSNRSRDRPQTELHSTSKNEKFKEGEGLGHEVMDVESKEGVDVGSRKAEMKASKRNLIFEAPNVLTIHLRRFIRDTNGIIKKINSHVNIQELLDLTPYMDPSCKDKEKPHYWLIGVVEHLGASLRGGYHVAYVRGVRSEGHELVWFMASDEVVQEVPLSKVLGSEAYILFYEKMES